MKFRIPLYIASIIFFIYGCNYMDKQTSDKNQKQEIVTKHDTICLNAPDSFQLKKINLIKTCKVVFSDSISYEFERNYSSGKHDSLYNYYDNIEVLKYSKSNDTIYLRIIFMISYDNVNIKPDILYSSNDTIYLIERIEDFSKNKRLPRHRFEEFFYVFKLSDTSFNPIFIRPKEINR